MTVMRDPHSKTHPGADGEELSPVMSENAFAMWGVDDVAYIRALDVNGQHVWGIFAADGNSLGMVPDRDLAFAAAIQNDKIPLSVH
jgi:hypothetical protein